MGILLWIAGAVLAFFAARLVPAGRMGRWSEALAAAVAGFASGVIATALDFGGWQEPDWRAGLFSFLGALLSLGLLRLGRQLLHRER